MAGGQTPRACSAGAGGGLLLRVAGAARRPEQKTARRKLPACVGRLEQTTRNRMDLRDGVTTAAAPPPAKKPRTSGSGTGVRKEKKKKGRGTGIGADSGRATYAPSLTQMDYLGVVGGEGVDLD
jgi:hypothetical protein